MEEKETYQAYPTVHWKTYLDPTNGPRVQTFIKRKGKVVFTELVKEIGNAYNNDIKKIVVLVHPNVSSLVLITDIDYIDVLDHCLYYFLDTEDYTMCEKIKKLKQKIKK